MQWMLCDIGSGPDLHFTRSPHHPSLRYLGMDCHLILRMGRAEVDRDPGLVGNLLVDR